MTRIDNTTKALNSSSAKPTVKQISHASGAVQVNQFVIDIVFARVQFDDS